MVVRPKSSELIYYFFLITLRPDPCLLEKSSDIISLQSFLFRRYEFNVEDGDVIMLATDGIFDNVPDSLLLEEISAKVTKEDLATSLQQCANSIALIAKSLSQDPNFLSPFAKNARDNGFVMSGGKEDDITILLAAVKISPEGRSRFSDSV